MKKFLAVLLCFAFMHVAGATTTVNTRTEKDALIAQLAAANTPAVRVNSNADGTYTIYLQGEETTAWPAPTAAEALASAKSTLIRKIDADADAVYGAVLGNRAQEYLDAYASALAYQDAGYTGAVPDDVQAWATAKSQTATWAADDIIATGTAWKAAKAAIRANRLAKKEAANTASDLAALDAVEGQWNAFVAYIKGQLGI